MLPLLAARGGLGAGSFDAALQKPIPAASARLLSSRYGQEDAGASQAAEGRRHRDGGGGDRRRGGGGGGRRFPRMHGEAPIDTPRSLQDYQNLVLGLARRKRCVAPGLAGGSAGHAAATAHASRGTAAGLANWLPSCPPPVHTLCRAYLIRDVLDEMLLNGMRPNRFILTTGGRPLLRCRTFGAAGVLLLDRCCA